MSAAALREALPRALAICLLPLSLSWTETAEGQLPPLAETGAQYLPASPVPEASGLRAQVSSYDVQVNAPLVLGKKTFVVPGLQVHVDSISYSNEPPGFTPLEALAGLDVPLLLAHQLSDAWTLSFRASPGVAGDLEKVDTGALRFSALAMATWAPSQTFTLGGGAFASYSFGQLLPLPLLYVDFVPRPYLRFEASLPFFATGLFRLGDRVELGALADVSGNEYAIRSRDISERYPCVGGADDASTPLDESRAALGSCADHLAYSVVAAGAVARVRLFSSVWLGSLLGHTLFRRYDVQNDAGSSVPGGDIDLPNVPLFRMTLTFRIPQPEAERASLVTSNRASRERGLRDRYAARPPSRP